jgi:hypothetical protein
MFIDDTQKNATLPIALSAAGSIGTAPLTVDIASSFNVTYTGALNGLVTLPTPTNAIAGDLVKVANTGTVAFKVGSIVVEAGLHTYLHWSGAAWYTMASSVPVEDEINVTGATMPVTFPITTLPGVPVFLPALPADSTKLYSITNGTQVQYAKWNGSQYISAPAPAITATSFQNDLGVGGTGKIETGFPLVRDTFTTGTFYREWNNNRTGVTGTGTGLVYGVNTYGLGSGYYDKAQIGAAAATFGYYNNVTSAYSFATGQQNNLSTNAISSFATGNTNIVSQPYSQALGYANTVSSYISLVAGYSNKNIGASYNVITGGYDNIISAGSYNAIGVGSSNRNNSASYASIENGNSNITGVGSYISVLNGSSNNSSQSYSLIGNGSSNTVSANYSTVINGSGNSVSASYSSALGSGHNVSGTYSNAFGISQTITGSASLVAGNSHVVGASYAGVFGYANTVNGTYNFASGYNNNLSAASFGNNVSGYSHIVTGERGVIGGNANTYAGSYSAMFGNANTMLAGRYGSLVAGVSNQMNGSWNSAILGEGNIVEAGGQYTKIVGGYFNTVKANTHVVFALGQSNTIGNATGLLTNSGAGAIGTGNTVVGAASVAIGQGNSIDGGTSYVIGLNYSVTGTNMVGIAGAGQNLGFYGKAPVPRPTLAAAATNVATTQTLVNSIRTALINLVLKS